MILKVVHHAQAMNGCKSIQMILLQDVYHAILLVRPVKLCMNVLLVMVKEFLINTFTADHVQVHKNMKMENV